MSGCKPIVYTGVQRVFYDFKLSMIRVFPALNKKRRRILF